jgi:hypothetical protein
MAQLGRFEITVEDTAGNASSGASVQIYVQGATVKTVNSGNNLDTYDVGGLVNLDSVQINATGNTRALTSVSATNVTVGGPGFVGTNQFDRIVQVTTPPTLYKEATGAVTISNPLTTDSNGYASCWLPVGRYDVVVSGGTPAITTRLITDYEVGAGENFRSTIFDGASAVGWIFDTLRSITTAGAKLLSVRTGGVEKFSVDRQGGFTAAQASTITAGGLTVSAGTSALQALTATTGSFSSTLSTTTDITMRRQSATNGTQTVAADYVLSAGWGNTATVSIVSTSRDMRGVVSVTANGAGIVANPTVKLTWKDAAWSLSPFAVVCSENHTNDQTTVPWNVLTTANDVTFTWAGTPTGGKIYAFSYVVLG